MAAVRSHLFTIDPGNLEEFLARRASLIGTIREQHPGLSSALLVKLDDGIYNDVWYWDSAEQMGAAFAAISTFTEAPLTMALTQNATAQNGQVIDKR